jgi:spermidine/putrescine-binding protein
MQRNEIVTSRRWPIATLVVLATVISSAWDANLDSDDQSTPPPGSSVAPDSSEALGRLDFLGFQGDDALEITSDFRQRTGLDLRSSYVSAEAEAEALVLSGAAGGVDIISFTSTASPSLQASGVLQPIDRSAVPNLEIMLPYFEQIAPEVFTDDAGELVCIPAYWGAIGVAFNSTVAESIGAFADLLDPAWTGRLTTVDVPNPLFYVAAVANDIDPSRMSEDDLGTLVDWLAPYMAQMKTFSPTFGDVITLLASGEVDAVMPGFDFIVNGAAAAGNDDIRIEIDLAEGVPILVSCQGIASTADNLVAAHAWLNNLLAPDVAAATAELQGGIATVEPAIDMIDADLRARYPYDDLGGYLQSSGIITDWPVSSDEFVDADDVAAAWAELKARSQS